LNLSHAFNGWEGSDDEIAADAIDAINSAIGLAQWKTTTSCTGRIIEVT
jgi:tRNA(Phe) wybutosine-synthesizing methylase Tyw3